METGVAGQLAVLPGGGKSRGSVFGRRRKVAPGSGQSEGVHLGGACYGRHGVAWPRDVTEGSTFTEAPATLEFAANLHRDGSCAQLAGRAILST